MTTLATLDGPGLNVMPGDEGSAALKVRNAGRTVEAYSFQVLGELAPWTVIEPAQLSIYPGAETTARVTFRPPRNSGVPVGHIPYAVRVIPHEYPDRAVVPEGSIQVLPFVELTAEITPHTSRGRGTGRHELAIDNRGNVPVRAEIRGVDSTSSLKFAARPPVVVVPPGEAVFVKLGVRHRRRLWSGEPVTRQFQALIIPENQQPIPVEAAAVQTPVFPKWTWKVLAALVILAILLAALWFGLLKPSIESAAKNAVAKPLQDAKDKAAAAQQAADRAETKADAANAGKNGAAPTATPKPGTVPAPNPNAGTVEGTYITYLDTAAKPGSGDSNTLTAPDRTTLNITDFTFENRQGDTGRVQLFVNGKKLMDKALANFRDWDYHVLTPIVLQPGDKMEMRIRCDAVGDALKSSSGGQCHPGLSIIGISRKKS